MPLVIRSGLALTVKADAPPGTFVGLLVTDGGLPRASKAEGTDAFVIVEQPAGQPFTVSRGGGLRVAGRVTPGVHTVKVYATTYDQKETEHRGPTVEVKVNVTREDSLRL